MTEKSLKQQRIESMIDWMVDYALSDGYMPSLSEICRAMKIASSTCHAWLAEAKAQKLVDYNSPLQGRSYTIKGVYYVDMREKDDLMVKQYDSQ